MLDLTQILTFLLGINIWLVAKGLALLAIFLYLLFSLIIVRQVNLMLDTLEVELEGLIRLVAWVHLLLVIGVLVFGTVYL
jgi:hypothetical protein